MSGGAPSPSGSQRLPGIDGLRAVSIALVLAGHAWASLPGAWPFQFLQPYVGNSQLGVRTFFVISGYLITWLLRREWERNGTISLKAFYTRRVLRIFPALYFYLAVLVGLKLAGLVHTTGGDLASAGTFTTNYKYVLPIASNEDYWFIGHFWTLALEEQFYLLWPAVLMLSGLRGGLRTSIAIVALSPLARVATYAVWPAARPVIGMMLHTAADPLMMGCAVALLENRPEFQALMRRVASPAWAAGAAVFVLAVSAWLENRFAGAYALTAGITLNSAAVAFLMIWIVRRPTSRVGRVLESRGFRHIGTLSYSLYLWQQLLLAPGSHPWVAPFPFNLVLCLLAAEVSYYVIERPFLRARDRYRARRPAIHGMTVADAVRG